MTPDDRRHGTTTGYRKGCRDDCCRQAVARQRADERKRYYLQRTTTFMTDGTGTRRRIQALAALGWAMSEISRRAGYDRSHAGLVCRRALINRTTADRFAEVYEALSMQAPPAATKNQRIDASRAKRIAARNGWSPPLAWEGIDIDDPLAEPWMPEQRGRGNPRSFADTVAEFDFLIRQGESEAGAMERLGIKRMSSFVDQRKRLEKAAS